MTTFTFKKAERLKSRKVIGRMFREGKSFGAYPLRLVFLKMEQFKGSSSVRFTATVPKKKFKSAVARNRIKRKLREAWRLNKHWLYQKLEQENAQYAFMVIYTGREEVSNQEIEEAIRSLNRRFVKKIIRRSTNPVRLKKTPSNKES